MARCAALSYQQECDSKHSYPPIWPWPGAHGGSHNTPDKVSQLVTLWDNTVDEELPLSQSRTCMFDSFVQKQVVLIALGGLHINLGTTTTGLPVHLWVVTS